MTDSHVSIDPAIMYFGTPVALLSTVDEQGKANLAPMSSVFWLGHTAALGMGSRSQTAKNQLATREVVISLASVDQVDGLNLLALISGVRPVPDDKAAVGYRHVGDKFSHAGVTPSLSTTVRAARVSECLVSLEGHVIDVQPLAEARPNYDLFRARGNECSNEHDRADGEAYTNDTGELPGAFVFSVHISRVWVDPSIQESSKPSRIDPAKWRPPSGGRSS